MACPDGQRFSDAGLLIDAAILGLGVGLARGSLISDHMTNETLMCPLPLAAPTSFAYNLLCLPKAASLPKIVRFHDWLRSEAVALAANAEPGDIVAS